MRNGDPPNFCQVVRSLADMNDKVRAGKVSTQRRNLEMQERLRSCEAYAKVGCVVFSTRLGSKCDYDTLITRQFVRWNFTRVQCYARKTCWRINQHRSEQTSKEDTMKLAISNDSYTWQDEINITVCIHRQSHPKDQT